MAAVDPAGFEPHPKDRLAEGDVWVGGRRVAARTLVAAVFRHVLHASALPPDGYRVILTYPEAWQRTRRGQLVDAAAEAGIVDPILVPEPAAAAGHCLRVHGHELRGGDLMVVDAGAGTIDIALVNRRNLTADALDGLADCGGRYLDELVVGVAASWARSRNPAGWEAIQEDASLRNQIWQEAREAKEMLSRASIAPLTVPGFGEPIHVTRAEFDAAATQLLSRLSAAVLRVLTKAGKTPDDLAGVYLVGGCSRIPALASTLHTSLGIAACVDEQPEMATALGAVSVRVGSRQVHRTRSATFGYRPEHVAVPPSGPTAAPPLRRRRVILTVSVTLVLLVAAALWIFGREEHGTGTTLEPVASIQYPRPREVEDPIDVAFDADALFLAAYDGDELRLARHDLPRQPSVWRVSTGLTREDADFVRLHAFGPTLVLEAIGSGANGEPRGTLIGYRASSGEELWHHDRYVLHADLGSRRISVRTNLVETGTSTEYAVLNVDVGTVVWRSDSAFVIPPPPPPARTALQFAVAARDASFVELHDLDSGGTIARTPLGGAATDQPFFDLPPAANIDGTIIIARNSPTGATTIHALATPDLTRRWETPAETTEQLSLWTCGLQYVCRSEYAHSNGFLAIDGRTGRTAWAASGRVASTFDGSVEGRQNLHDDRLLLDTSVPAGSETQLIDTSSGQILTIRRNEDAYVVDRDRVLLLPTWSQPQAPGATATPSARPDPVDREVSIMDTPSGVAYSIGQVGIRDRSTCFVSPTYLACPTRPDTIQVWRIPSTYRQNSVDDPDDLTRPSSEPPAAPGPTGAAGAGPPLPTAYDVSHAAPAESIWPAAVRHLPAKLPNGRDYGVISASGPDRLVVQEYAGRDRFGDVHVYDPGTNVLSRIFNAKKANPSGDEFGTGVAAMADAEHVVIETTAGERSTVWVVTLDGRIVQRFVPPGPGVFPPYAWVSGSLLWSQTGDAPDTFNTGGIWHGSPPSMMDGSTGFRLTDRSGWSVKFDDLLRPRRIDRWNVFTGERVTFTVPADVSWTALNCVQHWCVGLGDLTGGAGGPAIGVLRSDGTHTGVTLDPGTPTGVSIALRRFVTVSEADGRPGAILLWDTETGRVASLPGPESGRPNGDSILDIRGGQTEKVVLDLDRLT